MLHAEMVCVREDREGAAPSLTPSSFCGPSRGSGWLTCRASMFVAAVHAVVAAMAASSGSSVNWAVCGVTAASARTASSLASLLLRVSTTPPCSAGTAVAVAPVVSVGSALPVLVSGACAASNVSPAGAIQGGVCASSRGRLRCGTWCTPEAAVADVVEVAR